MLSTAVIVMAMSLQIHAADLANASSRADHGVELGPWYVIGPFKDTHFGIVTTSLAFPFALEVDALKNGGEPLLDKDYKAPKVPSYRDLNRRWEKKELTDGYSNFLPRGPAPARNETVYLYVDTDQILQHSRSSLSHRPIRLFNRISATFLAVIHKEKASSKS